MSCLPPVVKNLLTLTKTEWLNPKKIIIIKKELRCLFHFYPKYFLCRGRQRGVRRCQCALCEGGYGAPAVPLF